MADLPILFSASMVRALLDGRKTQTRRIVKPQPTMHDAGDCTIGGHRGPGDYLMREIYPKHMARFRKGDRLWVRETLKRVGNGWRYGADSAAVSLDRDHTKVHEMLSWAHHKERDTCVSIHMPRWASRLTLTVTDVRVQRLQDIKEADCVAEGPPNVSGFRYSGPASGLSGLMVVDPENPAVSMTPRTWYRELWDLINGAGSWDANPWIVALTFAVERRNIESAEAT